MPNWCRHCHMLNQIFQDVKSPSHQSAQAIMLWTTMRIMRLTLTLTYDCGAPLSHFHSRVHITLTNKVCLWSGVGLGGGGWWTQRECLELKTLLIRTWHCIVHTCSRFIWCIYCLKTPTVLKITLFMVLKHVICFFSKSMTTTCRICLGQGSWSGKPLLIWFRVKRWIMQ